MANTKKKAIKASIVHIASCTDQQESKVSANATGSRLTRAFLHIVKAKKCKGRSVGDLIRNIHTYAPKRAGLNDAQVDQLAMVSASHPGLLNKPIALPNQTRTSTSGRRVALLCCVQYADNFALPGVWDGWKLTFDKLDDAPEDLLLMYNLLVERKFSNEDITILTDMALPTTDPTLKKKKNFKPLPGDCPNIKPATEGELLAAFDALVPPKTGAEKPLEKGTKPLEKGDFVFFYFSGHGEYLKDENGDERDRQDECLVLKDTLVTDDVVFKRFVTKLKKGVEVLAVTDSCHSGTVLDLPYKRYSVKPANDTERSTPKNVKRAGSKSARQAKALYRTSPPAAWQALARGILLLVVLSECCALAGNKALTNWAWSAAVSWVDAARLTWWVALLRLPIKVMLKLLALAALNRGAALALAPRTAYCSHCRQSVFMRNLYTCSYRLQEHFLFGDCAVCGGTVQTLRNKKAPTPCTVLDVCLLLGETLPMTAGIWLFHATLEPIAAGNCSWVLFAAFWLLLTWDAVAAVLFSTVWRRHEVLDGVLTEVPKAALVLIAFAYHSDALEPLWVLSMLLYSACMTIPHARWCVAIHLAVLNRALLPEDF